MKTTPSHWENNHLATCYLNGMNDPVFVINKGVIVQDGNPAFFDFVGLKRPQVIGKLLYTCGTKKSHLDPIWNVVKKMVATAKPERAFVTVEGNDAKSKSTLLTPIMLADENDEPLLAIRVEDVSEMVNEKAEIEAEKMTVLDRAEALVHLNEELEGFSYSVAHDLRAPLRFIDRFAYLLLEKHSADLSREGLQYAEQIREGSRQMAQLIEDLLEFSRATAQELRSETFNLTRLANEVINQIQQDIEDRDVEITLKDLGDCNSDPNLLKQVLFNLLWNAVKFTRPIKQAKISLERKSIEGQYVYVVSDNGVGFDSKAAERLFTVFQRFHQPDDFEGSGVGLAIVGRIIGRHGGEVWAESRVGHGATFFFTLGQANNSLGKD